MNRAFIFPGQGSQAIGMGKDFFDNKPVAKDIFKNLDETLGYSLSDIIFNGPTEKLSSTIHTQPALMATSIAILKTLEHESGKTNNELCSVVAGHSLGEYSALCAAGVISMEDTTKLLNIRAESMQNAAPKGVGAMAACIGINKNELNKIIKNEITEGICQIANDNVEGQIVISGHEYNIDLIITKLKSSEYRAIKLNVSAPFHSKLIKDAEIIISMALENTKFNVPKVPVICNVTANTEQSPTSLKNNLVKQICSTVRWRETMHKLNELGITELVEIGSGRVLSGLAKKSPIDFKITNISNLQEFDEFLLTL